MAISDISFIYSELIHNFPCKEICLKLNTYSYIALMDSEIKKIEDKIIISQMNSVNKTNTPSSCFNCSSLTDCPSW